MARNRPSVVKDIGRAVTTTVAVPDVAPVADAVMVALPAEPPAVTWNCALVLVGPIRTLDGTPATLGLLLMRFAVSPFPPGAELTVTVIVPVLLARRFKGLGEREMGAGADEMITV